MRLSIIVPVHNMAADNKLRFCLDSLVNQTIADYEIIAVDDETIAGDKAFNWKNEFNEVDEAKFDIVLGNPPYVRNEEIKPIKNYLKKEYETYSGLADLYVFLLVSVTVTLLAHILLS